MRTREELHKLLKTVCDNIYYRSPPKGIKYPCIMYDMVGYSKRNADNKTYIMFKRYTITVIDENPDSLIPDKLVNIFEMINLDRTFQSFGLNHFVFNLYI